MDLKIDHQSYIPLHNQIEQILRKLIETDEYKNGKPLPKEVELSNRLGVSRNTVRQATNKLENEGLIIRKKGIGTFVTSHDISTQLNNWHSFTKEMVGKGYAFENIEVRVNWVAADEKLAQFFRIRQKTKIQQLIRLRGIQGEPIVIFESYFHPRIKFEGNENFEQPLYQLLEKEFNILVERSHEHIRSQLAGNVAKTLHLQATDPILVRERFVYDSGDKPTEYAVVYYRADKFTYSINIKKWNSESHIG